MKVKRIRDLREDKDLKQKDMAKILNISQQQYSRIENGTNEIKIDGLIKLSEIYNVSIDYILELTDEKEPYPRKK